MLGGFPGGTSLKEPTCQCRRHKRHGFGPWVGKSPLEKGMANPLQYSCLKNPMDREAWWTTAESDVTGASGHINNTMKKIFVHKVLTKCLFP